MNKCYIQSLAIYIRFLTFFSGLLASVVHNIIVMAQRYKGYTNIVEVFGSLPPTQSNRFILQ